MSRQSSSGKVKPRELRRRVVLPARMRLNAGWIDACILNISSRGLLLYSMTPVTEGSYVQLRHGRHVIVARVIWRNGPKAGLSAEERLPVEELAIASQTSPIIFVADDQWHGGRRKRPRTHDQARLQSRAMEFVSIALVGVFLASSIFALMEKALAIPLAQIQTALGG